MRGWKEWLNQYDYLLNYYRIAPLELSKKHFDWLKKECIKAKKTGVKHNRSLVGHIKEEYAMPGVEKSFLDFLLSNASYNKVFEQYIKTITLLSENKPLYLDSFWVNYMKKHEFNPIHDHKGLYSFVIFVKIPYDLKKEERHFKDCARSHDEVTGHSDTSKFNFVNIDSGGKIVTTTVPVDKSFEGKMFMFPATQSHLVYPFYTSDDYRITVSGNIKIKV